MRAAILGLLCVAAAGCPSSGPPDHPGLHLWLTTVDGSEQNLQLSTIEPNPF